MVTLDQAKVILVLHEMTEKSPRYRAITDLIYRRGYVTTAGTLVGMSASMSAEELDDMAKRLEQEWMTRWEMPT